MYIVLLKFSDNKGLAAEYMDAHNIWIKKGFDAGVFVLVGSLQPSLGGAVVAHNCARAELERLVNDDPFVAQNVVTAEIIEITPAKADERLQFLLN